jgi:hypothetical protein
MLLAFIILNFLVIFTPEITGQETCGNYRPYCKCLNFENVKSTQVECEDFDKLKNLDFAPSIGYRNYSKLVLKPRNSVNLDTSLKLEFETSDNFKLIFYQVHKIDILESLFQNIKNLKEIKFIDSNLNFMHHEKQCQYNGPGLFANLNLDKLEFDNVVFENKLCPAMFQNSRIGKLDFINTNSHDAIESNYESYRRLGNTSFHFNIHIHELKIQNDQDFLHESNRHLFKNTHQLVLRLANLKDIGDHYFSSFEHLRIFQLYNADIKRIFKGGSVKWLKSLNPLNNYNLDDPNFKPKHFEKFLNLQLLTGKSVDFSDESFCNFEYFPHNQLVFLLREKFNEEAKTCSCTIYWLYKYYNLYKSLTFDEIFLPKHCLNVPDLNERIQKCDLDTRVSQCPGHVKDLQMSSTTTSSQQFYSSRTRGDLSVATTLKATSSASVSNVSKFFFIIIIISYLYQY